MVRCGRKTVALRGCKLFLLLHRIPADASVRTGHINPVHACGASRVGLPSADVHRHGSQVIPPVGAAGACSGIKSSHLRGANGLVGAEDRLWRRLDGDGLPGVICAVVIVPDVKFNRIITG